MRIQNYLSLSSWLGTAQPINVQPIILFTSQLPSLIIANFSGAEGYDVYEWEYSYNNAFTESTSGTGGGIVVNNFGAGEFHLRVRGLNTVTNERTNYNTVVRVIEATPLRTLFIDANAEDGQVVIVHNITTDDSAVSEVVEIWRRANSTGVFAVVASFNPLNVGDAGISPYIDTTVVNGTFYEYFLRMVASSIDNISSQSNVDSATPQSSTPTLSTPTGLNMAWDEVTAGTGVFTWNTVLNATSYDVLLDDVFVANVASATRTFTGLTIAQSYKFSVVAKAAGYTDSATAFINRTAPDPLAEDVLVSNFVEPYLKPFNGMNYAGLQFPLINYDVLDEAAFNSLTGLTYSSYPQGATLITPVTDEAVPVTAQFTSTDVGMRFCGLKANVNGAAGTFVDEYPAFDISARYSNVIWQNGNTCVVDFAYNRELQGGSGYIFRDCTIGLNTAFTAWLASTSVKLKMQPLERTSNVLSVYVAPELAQINVSGTQDRVIYADSNQPWSVMWGVEDYFNKIAGALKYVQPIQLFNFSSTPKFLSLNGKWTAPHSSFIAAASFERAMERGTLGANGIAAFYGCDNRWMYNAIASGYGVDDLFMHRFDVRAGTLNVAGTYAGEGVLNDVDNFGFIYHHGFYYSGASALGFRGGATAGATFEIYDGNWVGDFENQQKWAAPTILLESVRFTNDYTGLAAGANTSYLPTGVTEITTNAGNWYAVRAMGGGNRQVILNVDGFLAPSNVRRFNQFGIWNKFYSYDKDGNALETFVTDNDGLNTLTPKKQMNDWDIVTEKDVDNVTPKLITISRNYFTNRQFDEFAIADIASEMRGFTLNAIRTHINWSCVFGKIHNEFVLTDFQYINKIDRRPKAWQINDSFKICAWVEVSTLVGIEVGDTVTGATATGVVRAIDNNRHTNRVVIGSATSSFHLDATVTIGDTSYTVTDASNFEPTEVYTFIRKQRGGYAGSGTPVSFINPTSETGTFTNGMVCVGQTSAAVGTWNGNTYASNLNRTLRVSSGNFIAGEEVICTVDSVEVCRFTIPIDTPYARTDNGIIPKHFGMDYSLRAGMVSREEGGFCYWDYLITDKDLPLRINAKDNDLPIFEIEVVNSTAEYLLDGATRPMRHTYRGIGGNGNGFHSVSNNRHITSNYANGTGLIPSTDGFGWLSAGDPPSHLFYTIAQLTRYWYDGDTRGGAARVNGTSKSSAAFSGLTKGWYIKNVINIPGQQWMAFDSGSSNAQWETSRLYAEANPLHDPDYATREGVPYPAKLGFYGTNSADSKGNISDPTNTNIVRNSDASAAPALPTTLTTFLNTYLL